MNRYLTTLTLEVYGDTPEKAARNAQGIVEWMNDRFGDTENACNVRVQSVAIEPLPEETP